MMTTTTHLFLRTVSTLAATWACLLGASAQAQQAPNPSAASAVAVATARYTIAMVLPKDDAKVEAGFMSYLQRQDVPVRYVHIRFSGKAADIADLRSRVRAARPDLVYVWGTPTTLALAGRHDQAGKDDAVRDIPIVFTEVTDPVASGLLPSLEKPGRNVTGVSHVAPLPVQLNTIRAYRPFKKLGYLHNPAEPNSAIIRDRIKDLARSQGFEVVDASLPLLPDGTPDPAQIAPKVHDIAQRGADFLYVGPITFLAFTHRDDVTRAALDNKLPTFCATESIVRQSGCMFGLFSNDSNTGRFAASMARQILVEKKPPQAIPASTLQRFSLLINMRTVQALGLYPPMLLLNVAEVINVPAQAAQ
ncbi:ABC transporter substrate-binding protein [Ramlibacter sp. H39-3-26]|uniref:ABC transporter substrate-binding protein n=1 Tax=Curvibacter soli TaxID=3031331 RepID=UPI0023DB5041|nr:ABC transporter substrate-binding protein [Ramlibacter sp. H39-3-26]MDF1485553.1 ABC transporter substrate-binding protein [Ramlibacter sp. H39-3-26]